LGQTGEVRLIINLSEPNNTTVISEQHNSDEHYQMCMHHWTGEERAGHTCRALHTIVNRY